MAKKYQHTGIQCSPLCPKLTHENRTVRPLPPVSHPLFSQSWKRARTHAAGMRPAAPLMMIEAQCLRKCIWASPNWGGHKAKSGIKVPLWTILTLSQLYTSGQIVLTSTCLCINVFTQHTANAINQMPQARGLPSPQQNYRRIKGAYFGSAYFYLGLLMA